MIQQPHAIDLPNQAALEYLRPEPAAEFLRARIGQVFTHPHFQRIGKWRGC